MTARYDVSLGSYNDVAVKEWMHVPALGVALCDHVSLLGEVVFWNRHTPEGSSVVERSLNITLFAHL